MRKVIVLLVLLGAANMSLATIRYWNPVPGSDAFADGGNWSATASSTASDSLRVGADTGTYANSASLCKITTEVGTAAGTGNLNDALAVGGYGYTGNAELDNAGYTAYLRSVIVGDTKTATSPVQAASVLTITRGTIRNGNVALDTGYMTIGRNNTTGITDPARAGVGYLNINGGTVAMDRITVGELRAGETYAGTGHIVLQNDGVINLPCEKTFDPASYIGLKINNGDFTWIDNGASTVRTGSLSLGKDGGLASLIFQSTDNVIGQDGKGIVVFQNVLAADGKATFSASAIIDVTGLVDSTSWVTLITAKNGFTFADTTLLSDASVAEGWGYRTVNVTDGMALQVAIPEPATIALLAAGLGLFGRRRK